jgi:hypothetical protein
VSSAKAGWHGKRFLACITGEVDMRLSKWLLLAGIIACFLMGGFLYYTSAPPGYREVKRNVKVGMKKAEIIELLDKNDIGYSSIRTLDSEREIGIGSYHISHIFLVVECRVFMDFCFDDAGELADYRIDFDSGL